MDTRRFGRRIFSKGKKMSMKFFFLYSPSAATAEILDSLEMTKEDAVSANIRLREQGSDNRWIGADLWDDEVEYANGPADEYYHDDPSDCY